MDLGLLIDKVVIRAIRFPRLLGASLCIASIFFLLPSNQTFPESKERLGVARVICRR